MIPLAAQKGDIKNHHYAAYRVVVKELVALPDGATCHDACRACRGPVQANIGHLARVSWVTGKFNGLDHSWLEFEGEQVILDPYPWASGTGPLLVTTAGQSPWKNLYVGEVVW